MTVDIVIGLGYGDEGKGITTDYLCSRLPTDKTLVVRFSGGQQAGHTVMLDNIKHIHSNFCSGSLRGIPSYFSEHTTFYPVSIVKEIEVLLSKGITPKLTLHPLAKMTTPWDVFYNKQDSVNLSNGTCGMGVGKTIDRNNGPLKLYAIDLLNPSMLMDKIEIISQAHTFLREKENKEKYEEINAFLEAISILRECVDIRTYHHYLEKFDHLIFEGSQGILLDKDHGLYPYVTYANTTSKNVYDILNQIGVKEKTHTYYVTRAYATRHGNGPFNESSDLILRNNKEEINTFNDFQRAFKIGYINYDFLNYALKVDSIYNDGKVNKKSLVVTCLDQMPNDFLFNYNKILNRMKIDSIYESYSPFSKDFKIKTI